MQNKISGADLRRIIEEIELPCNFYNLELNKHECACFIEKCVKSGHMKKCAHLQNHECGSGFGGSYYVPVCNENSFLDFPSDRRSVCNGCPDDCRYYESYRKKKVKSLIINTWRIIINNLKGIAEWFAALPWIIQVFILIIVLFILKADTLIKLLVSIIKGL